MSPHFPSSFIVSNPPIRFQILAPDVAIVDMTRQAAGIHPAAFHSGEVVV
ncbi:hypothetical protein [Halorubrum sp. DTA98]